MDIFHVNIRRGTLCFPKVGEWVTQHVYTASLNAHSPMGVELNEVNGSKSSMDCRGEFKTSHKEILIYLDELDGNICLYKCIDIGMQTWLSFFTYEKDVLIYY